MKAKNIKIISASTLGLTSLTLAITLPLTLSQKQQVTFEQLDQKSAPYQALKHQGFLNQLEQFAQAIVASLAQDNLPKQESSILKIDFEKMYWNDEELQFTISNNHDQEVMIKINYQITDNPRGLQQFVNKISTLEIKNPHVLITSEINLRDGSAKYYQNKQLLKPETDLLKLIKEQNLQMANLNFASLISEQEILQSVTEQEIENALLRNKNKKQISPVAIENQTIFVNKGFKLIEASIDNLKPNLNDGSLTFDYRLSLTNSHYQNYYQAQMRIENFKTSYTLGEVQEYYKHYYLANFTNWVALDSWTGQITKAQFTNCELANFIGQLNNQQLMPIDEIQAVKNVEVFYTLPALAMPESGKQAKTKMVITIELTNQAGEIETTTLEIPLILQTQLDTLQELFTNSYLKLPSGEIGVMTEKNIGFNTEVLEKWNGETNLDQNFFKLLNKFNAYHFTYQIKNEIVNNSEGALTIIVKNKQNLDVLAVDIPVTIGDPTPYYVDFIKQYLDLKNMQFALNDLKTIKNFLDQAGQGEGGISNNLHGPYTNVNQEQVYLLNNVYDPQPEKTTGEDWTHTGESWWIGFDPSLVKTNEAHPEQGNLILIVFPGKGIAYSNIRKVGEQYLVDYAGEGRIEIDALS